LKLGGSAVREGSRLKGQRRKENQVRSKKGEGRGKEREDGGYWSLKNVNRKANTEMQMVTMKREKGERLGGGKERGGVKRVYRKIMTQEQLAF